MRYKIEKNTVQETLIIPLYAQKMCSELYPNLYRDEAARRLVNAVDYDFSALEKKSRNLMQRFGFLEVAMRQNDLAYEVRDYLKTHPTAAVVNLGCGLDCTGRACDNGHCKIYNLDFSDVIAVRNQLLPAGDRETNIPCDLNDTAWLDKIDASGGAVFFAAGVFYYFLMYMSENKMVVADALARIDSVLEAAPMQVQAVPQHPQDASVALQNVHFSYDGKNEVIKGVSLEIQPGQTVAFVGPSGGGKSTLANLVCRFFDVQSGSVRVGGADVRDIPKEELMDTISFVFQNSRLLKGSILDNVRLGRPQATEAEVLAALKAAQCMDIIEKFPAGIHTVIGTKGVYLSGGEQQRIAIARAMLKNAPILILDEATAFADPDNEAKVQAAFARLAKGKTVLMIAHRLSTVANADCIYVVQDGQIAESGTKDELCTQNGLFARMWQEYQASVQWKVAKEG